MSNPQIQEMPQAQPRASRQPRGKFILWTMIAAGTAALAAWLSAALGLEVWMMFVGFIAWFTRPASLKDSLAGMLCLWLGIAIGAGSYVLTGTLIPSFGAVALPAGVFLVAVIILGLRNHALLGNMLAWFLGLVTFFAAELDLAVASFTHMALATAIGGSAGYISQILNRHFAE